MTCPEHDSELHAMLISCRNGSIHEKCMGCDVSWAAEAAKKKKELETMPCTIDREKSTATCGNPVCDNCNPVQQEPYRVSSKPCQRIGCGNVGAHMRILSPLEDFSTKIDLCDPCMTTLCAQRAAWPEPTVAMTKEHPRIKLGKLQELRFLYYEAQAAKLEAQLAAIQHDLALSRFNAEFGALSKEATYDAEIQKIEAERKEEANNDVSAHIPS